MRPIVDFKLTTISGLYKVFHNPMDDIIVRADSEKQAKQIYCNYCLSNGEEVDIKDVSLDYMYYFEEVTTGFTMSEEDKIKQSVWHLLRNLKVIIFCDCYVDGL